MSERCEFEFVPMKRAARDSVAQIGNHTSRSEASIQSETALNAGETEASSTDQLGARRRGEQVQDEDFSIKKEKNYADVAAEPIVASVPHFCSNCKVGILQDHGSHTPLQDEG